MNFNKFTSFEKIISAFPTLGGAVSLGVCQIHQVGNTRGSRLRRCHSNGFCIALMAIISFQRIEPFGVLTEDLTLGLCG